MALAVRNSPPSPRPVNHSFRVPTFIRTQEVVSVIVEKKNNFLFSADCVPLPKKNVVSPPRVAVSTGPGVPVPSTSNKSPVVTTVVGSSSSLLPVTSDEVVVVSK